MKKRVHELSKDLKAHDIDLKNEELVKELQSFGYDVKSHSSTLEDDQARAAVEKIVAKRKPKAAPPPVKAAGFVVRRKIEVAPPPPPPLKAAPVYVPEPTPVAAAPVPVAVEPVEVAPQAGTTPAPVQAASTAPVAAEPAAAAPAAAAAPVAAVPALPPAVVARTTVTSAHAPGNTVQVQMKPSVPGAPTVGASPSNNAQVVRGPMNTVQVATGDGARRPTATQAVVVSRPLIPIKRVTPPSSAVKNIPIAPGPRAIGQIQEFKVVPDALGNRDLVEVRKGAVGDRKKTKEGVAETLSKQEIQDIARGRTTLPIRGKKRKPTKKGNKTQITSMGADKKVVRVQEVIGVAQLSQQMGVRASDLINKLMKLGQMVTMNQMLDVATAEILAADFGWKVEKTGFSIDQWLDQTPDTEESRKPRPPVVTVMGHVDHGKTSLLDAIRSANVAAGEAGGITQHIGAYSVRTAKGPITFLDTPGHEAFSAMRARGAKVTDLVVLVVAADDGVQPQTIESIQQAQKAGVPIIVAINKIDKPEVDPSRVKTALMEHQLVPEEFGGDTIMVPLSAKTRKNLDQLLEMIALQAEVLELKANPRKRARGRVIEAKLDKGRGPVATVLVQEGTLKLGDAIVTGTVSGKVRAMMNERGDNVQEVGPGYPVEVLGLSGVPVAGDEFHIVADERVSAQIAEFRAEQERKKSMATTAKSKIDDLFARIDKPEVKELRLIVKGDTQGSVEAVSTMLTKLSGPKVKLTVLQRAVGGVNEGDVKTATSSKAMIVGFNSKIEATAANIASQHGVVIKNYSIIYEAVDEVRLAMEDLLEPIRREKSLGKAEVRQLFIVPKLGTIAGCAVVDGKITRSASLRLLRAGKVQFQGRIKSLRRVKDDVREVANGLECGIGLDGFNDILAGDVIEAFEIEEIRQKL